MDGDDQYDYSATTPFMEEFINPFPDKPFLSEFHDNYGKLWTFKECVKEWTFGVSHSSLMFTSYTVSLLELIPASQRI